MMNQYFKKPQIYVQRNKRVVFTFHQPTQRPAYINFGTPNVSKSPEAPKNLFKSFSQTQSRSDSVPNSKQIIGTPWQYQLEKAPKRPLNQVPKITLQGLKTSQHFTSQQIRNQGNSFLTGFSGQNEQNKNPNGQSYFVKRCVELQAEVTKLQILNSDLLQRLKDLSNKKKECNKGFQHQPQKAKQQNQFLYQDNNKNAALSARIKDLEKMLQDQEKNFTAQVNLRKIIMEKQISNLKSCITKLTQDKNKQIQALSQKIKIYEKKNAQFDPQIRSQLDWADLREVKITSMRYHSDQQQKRINLLEKRLNELQHITDQFYQMVNKLFAFDIRDVAERYLSFKHINCSEITITQSEDKLNSSFHGFSDILGTSLK